MERGDEWETDLRKCYRAAAGAYFAQQLHQRLAEGLNPADEDEMDRLYEEACTVGVEFAERVKSSG